MSWISDPMGALLADVAGKRVFARRGFKYAWVRSDADEPDRPVSWQTVTAVLAREMVQRVSYDSLVDQVRLTAKGEAALDAYAARQQGSR